MSNPVATLRKVSGLNWSEIGALLGSHRTTVMRWEKGESEIPGPAARLIDRLIAEYRGVHLAQRQNPKDSKVKTAAAE